MEEHNPIQSPSQQQTGQGNNLSPKKPDYLKLAFWCLVALIIVSAIAAAYQEKIQPVKNISNTNPKVSTQAPGYPFGTQIVLSTTLPAAFPKNLWVGTESPRHIDVMKRPDGITQTTVSYITSQKMPAIMDAEKNALVKAGWKIGQSNSATKSSYIMASLNLSNMIITVSPVASSTFVTFQLTQINK